MKSLIKRVIFLSSKIFIFKKIYNYIGVNYFENFFNTKWVAVYLNNEDVIVGSYNPHIYSTWQSIIEEKFESFELSIAKKAFVISDFFIDIGSHIGLYSILASKYIKKEGKIISFEPNSEAYDSFIKNIRFNNILNVEKFNIALSDKKGEEYLFGDDSSKSIINDAYFGKDKDKKLVKTDILDNYIKLINKDSLVSMKIDVESAEFNVLSGATRFFEEIKPFFILLEMGKYWETKINPNFKDTFKYFSSRGYLCYRLVDNKLKKIDYNTVFVDVGDYKYTINYFFIRKDMESVFC